MEPPDDEIGVMMKLSSAINVLFSLDQVVRSSDSWTSCRKTGFAPKVARALRNWQASAR